MHTSCGLCCSCTSRGSRTGKVSERANLFFFFPLMHLCASCCSPVPGVVDSCCLNILSCSTRVGIWTHKWCSTQIFLLLFPIFCVFWPLPASVSLDPLEQLWQNLSPYELYKKDGTCFTSWLGMWAGSYHEKLMQLVLGKQNRVTKS